MEQTVTIEIDGYTIDSILGKGGMATVYLAHHIGLQRPAAIKVMSKHFLADHTFSERFLHEARTVAKLRHPHIVTVYDVGAVDEVPYMAMEYLPGGDLKQRIAHGITPDIAVNYLITIAETLNHAHTMGCIHRDVKPDNILFDEQDELSIVDFGVAKTLLSDTALTMVGTIVGTPKYMSPEQGKGDHVSPKSDIYSLGVIFFEMLTGNPPYDADSSVSLLIRHLQDPIPTLPSRLIAFQPLINGLLAKDPEQRLYDIDEIKKLGTGALRQYRKQKGAGTSASTQSVEDSVITDNDRTLLMDETIAGNVATDAAKLENEDKTEVRPPASSLSGKEQDLSNLAPEPQPEKRSNKPVSIAGTIVLLATLGIGTYFLYSESQQLIPNDEQAVSAESDANSGSASLDLNADRIVALEPTQSGIPASTKTGNIVLGGQDATNSVQSTTTDTTPSVADMALARIKGVEEILNQPGVSIEQLSHAVDVLIETRQLDTDTSAYTSATELLEKTLLGRIKTSIESQNFSRAREYLDQAEKLGLKPSERDELTKEITQAETTLTLKKTIAEIESLTLPGQLPENVEIAFTLSESVADPSLTNMLSQTVDSRIAAFIEPLLSEQQFSQAREFIGNLNEVTALRPVLAKHKTAIDVAEATHQQQLALKKRITDQKAKIDRLIEAKKFFSPPNENAYQAALLYRRLNPGDSRFFNGRVYRITTRAQKEAIRLFEQGKASQSRAIVSSLKRHFPRLGRETESAINRMQLEQQEQVILAEMNQLLTRPPSLSNDQALVSRYNELRAQLGAEKASELLPVLTAKLASHSESLMEKGDFQSSNEILKLALSINATAPLLQNLQAKLSAAVEAREAELAAQAQRERSRSSKQDSKPKPAQPLPSLPTF